VTGEYETYATRGEAILAACDAPDVQVVVHEDHCCYDETEVCTCSPVVVYGGSA